MGYLHKNRTNDGSSETDAAQNRAISLLRRWGAAPLLYFALLPDKRYLLGDEADWGIAFRVVGRHALALGDPLGDPGRCREAVGAFLALCRRQGWRPAFYQVTPQQLETYREAGLRAVKIGEDAQIGLPEFSLAGKRFKNLRNDLRRIEKSGITREEYGPDNPPESHTVAEMAMIAAGWRRAHRAREGSFAMGGFDPDSALFRDSRLFVARDLGTGRILAFVTFVPIFGPGQTQGWALDLMRRRADAQHGVMDYLIVSAAQEFASEGATRMSLGLSPLAGAAEPGELAQITHVRRFLFMRMNRVYNFQGLHTFKAKFATHWEPRYLIYRRGSSLAGTAGAILKAHLGPGEPPSALPPSSRRGRTGRRRAMACAAFLVLLLTPFEKTLAKTLAKRAVTLPHQMARTWERRSVPVWRGIWRPPAVPGHAAGVRSSPTRT